MTVTNDDEEFARGAKACFDASVERLDGETRSRLNRARHRALARRREPSVAARRGWLPAMGLAAAVFCALLLLQTPGPAILPPADLPRLAELPEQDSELLFGDDNLEMFEDLEFYYWMEEFDGTATINLG